MLQVTFSAVNRCELQTAQSIIGAPCRWSHNVVNHPEWCLTLFCWNNHGPLWERLTLMTLCVSLKIPFRPVHQRRLYESYSRHGQWYTPMIIRQRMLTCAFVDDSQDGFLHLWHVETDNDRLIWPKNTCSVSFWWALLGGIYALWFPPYIIHIHVTSLTLFLQDTPEPMGMHWSG